MNYYIIRYELDKSNHCDINQRENDLIRIIQTYPGSIRLLDNTYYIESFQDIPTVMNQLSLGLNNQDKLVIAQVRNYTGKRTPNI